MGTWGTGLYSDDTACDVRDDYKAILGDGIAEPEATHRILAEWKNELSDPDTAPVFWLALADTQWNLGRLQERVKHEALAAIDNGTDLARWLADKKLAHQRQAILERLRQKLNSTQPAIKKVKKRFVDSTDWELGDVYSLRLQSGEFVLLHVIGFHQDKGGRAPVCALFDWTGNKIPDGKTIQKMDYKLAKVHHQRIDQFLLGSLNAKDLPKERVSLVAQGIKPKQKCGGYTVIFWRWIDKHFEELFGLN